MKIERQLLEKYLKKRGEYLTKVNCFEDKSMKIAAEIARGLGPYVAIDLRHFLDDSILLVRDVSQRLDYSKIIKALEALGVEVTE